MSFPTRSPDSSAMEREHMKIVKLSAENIKRLKAVEITPDRNTVVIAGKNGQGKTSVLDAIVFALAGTAAQKDTPRPIRDGEDHASVTLDLGDLTVRREWKGERQTLVVTAKDGARYASPQKMLDEFIGRLSFDPLAFSHLPDREQLRQLLDLVELPFDPVKLDAERKAVFDERTDINRDSKRLAAQLQALPKPEAGLPEVEVQADEVQVSMLVGQYQVAQQQHADHELCVRTHKQASDRVEQLRRDLADAENVLARTPTPDPIALLPDLDEYRSRINAADETNRKARLAADETNRKIRAAADYTKAADVVRQVRDASEELTKRLTEIDRRKEDALAAAEMPIDGLSFDEQGVTYNGMPFRQCSAAERLRVSLAMAMAMNPKIRVIRITDGSLLDSSNMALIEEMASTGDFQVWIERVDESGSVGVVIEDGQVRA